MSKTEVYISNLAQYNAGHLVGEWFTLSDGEEALAQVLESVLGKDEEYFISDYAADFEIAEYDNLLELVKFATKFDALGKLEKAIVSYLLEYAGAEKAEILEKIEADSLLDEFVVYEAANERELGLAIADCMEIPEHLAGYIDYERIGRDEVYAGAVQIGDYYLIAC